MIEIKAIEPRDEARQIAYFTIDGQEFSCGNVPTELTKAKDVQAHLDARADEFKLLILRKQYPESDHLRFQKDNMTELQSMEAWIDKGHKNLMGKDGKKNIYELIEKQELEYRHPKWIRLLPLIEASNVAKEVKDLLKEIVK